MPGKLISNLRFLNPPPAALQSVRVGPTTSRGATTGILSRIFPFKLKYVGVGLGPPGVRSFRASASKSLIEDDAELSSWVSGMRNGSLRGSGDEDGDEGFGSGRGSGMDWGRGRGRGRGMGRGRGRGGGREGFSGKRSREEEDYGGDLEEDRFGSKKKRGGGGGEFRSWGRGGGRGREVDFGGRKSSGRGEGGYSSGNGRGREVDFGGRRGGRALGGRGRGRGGDRGSYDDKGEISGMRGNGKFDSGRGGRGRMQFGDGNGRDFGERRGGKVESVRKSFYEEEEEEEEEEEDRVRVAMIGSDLGDFSHNESESDDDEGEDYDDDGGVGNTARTSLGLKEDAGGRITTVSTGPSDSYLTETRFDQCAISPLSMKAVRDAGYEKMTVVQEATLPIILKGKDVLAKAKTGTGKTVAFLLPSIEVVAKTQPVGGDEKRPPILVLVICPTRELASQAASEANKLLKYHRSIGVQVVIGGTRLPQEQKRMQTNPCQILVATPGRLQDHIENTAGFATRLMGVKILVLDEADHLLDMGFRRAIEKIIAAVPKQRQTLLFSATVPDEVRQICHLALKKDHEYINTVEEGTEETHAKVRQMHLVAPLEKQFPILYTLLKDHIADNSDFKVLVFCTTAMVTRLVADLLGKLHLNVREIHSRKPQSYRTRVSDEFRKSNGLILVTSDVSARGVDYPDVTLVVQVGVPADRQQYIHRLGRTGRKGKEGEGILLLAPWEEFFVSTIRDLPITKGTLPSVDPGTAKKVEHALSNVEMKNKEAAYQAWLGYYNSNRAIGKDKAKLVELASSFSRSMGLGIPPAISKMVLGKMGLKNVPGLRSK